MKKVIALLLIAVFAFSLVACNEAVNDESSVAESKDISEIPESSVEESTEASAEVSDEVSAEVSDEVSEEESDEVSTEVSDDESSEESQEESTEEKDSPTESFKVGENTVNIFEDEHDGYRKISVTFADSTKLDLYENYSIYDICVSADEKHMIFCSYEWEAYGDIYLFNFEKKKLTKLPLYDAVKDRVPYQAAWVGNEHFLFSDIMNAGTIAIGGDVCCYDIISGENKKIIVTPEDWRLQITDITRTKSGFRFICGYYDESFNEYEEHLFTLSYDRVTDLINGETALKIEYSDGRIKEVGAKEDAKIAVNVDFASDELLADKDAYVRYDDPDDSGAPLAFKTDTKVTNFRYFSIFPTDTWADDGALAVDKVLYTLDEFTPDMTFVADVVSADVFPIRGISFVDANGNTQYYSLHFSAYDGSIVFGRAEIAEK